VFAASYIRRLIFILDLRAGDRVPPDRIGEALGISRIPVREALIILEREGWITTEPYRGAFVTALDAEAVRDHFSMFGLIYGFAATCALTRVTDVQDLADRLQGTLGELEDDPVAASRMAMAFHDAIIEGARSPRIHTVLGAMSGLVPGNFFAEVPGAISVQRNGLAEITRAVRRNDGKAATRGYEAMMHCHGELVVQLLEAKGFFD
jgi:DNA-binding GntR family transcriptional regulator